MRHVDYGEGAPGGGSNDDYLQIRDTCPDGHGVRLYLQWNGVPIGPHYLGNGYGSSLIWDPFSSDPQNVAPGDDLRLRVCIVDGHNDTTPDLCGIPVVHTSIDG